MTRSCSAAGGCKDCANNVMPPKCRVMRHNLLFIVLGLLAFAAIFACPWSIIWFGVCLNNLHETAFGPYGERSLEWGCPASIVLHVLGILALIMILGINWKGKE